MGDLPSYIVMMLNWQDFDVVFQAKPDYAYDNKTVENITRHRKEFGELFFDRIWKSIGLMRPSRNNYPPRTNQDLRNLWSKIVQSCIAPQDSDDTGLASGWSEIDGDEKWRPSQITNTMRSQTRCTSLPMATKMVSEVRYCKSELR